MSLQSMNKTVRHTICKEFYTDVDIVNAHPVLLSQYLTKADIEHNHLKYYIKNKNELFDQMMTTGYTRDESKVVVLKIMSGGVITEEELDNLPDEIKLFNEEMKRTRITVFGREPEIMERCSRKKKKNNQTMWNVDGSVISMVLYDIENLVMLKMFEYFESRGLDVDVLVFDGIMIRKHDSIVVNQKSLGQCSDYIFDMLQL